MIDKEEAIELTAKYIAQKFVEGARGGAVSISDRWPDGTYRQADEPVWTLTLPPDSPMVGAHRVIVILSRHRKRFV